MPFHDILYSTMTGEEYINLSNTAGGRGGSVCLEKQSRSKWGFERISVYFLMNSDSWDVCSAMDEEASIDSKRRELLRLGE
jgi:hypothetical protein